MSYDSDFAHRIAYYVRHYGGNYAIVGYGNLRQAGFEFLQDSDLERLAKKKGKDKKVYLFHPEFDVQAVLLSYVSGVPIIQIQRMTKKEMVVNEQL